MNAMPCNRIVPTNFSGREMRAAIVLVLVVDVYFYFCKGGRCQRNPQRIPSIPRYIFCVEYNLPCCWYIAFVNLPVKYIYIYSCIQNYTQRIELVWYNIICGHTCLHGQKTNLYYNC